LGFVAVEEKEAGYRFHFEDARLVSGTTSSSAVLVTINLGEAVIGRERQL
jgi:hypothetical protein